jgi:hypothetical protein
MAMPVLLSFIVVPMALNGIILWQRRPVQAIITGFTVSNAIGSSILGGVAWTPYSIPLKRKTI